MKRGNILRLASLLCLAALILSLSACTFYQGDSMDYVKKDGVGYTVSGIVKRCFVSYIEIPAGQTEYEVTIPDKLDSGHKVEGLGGFVGSGAPNPCEVYIGDMKTQNIYGDEYEEMLSADDFIEYKLTINVGKYAGKIFFRDANVYVDDEAYVYLKVSDNNETSSTADTDENEKTTVPQYIRIKVYINIDEENEYLYSKDGTVYVKEKEASATE